MDADRDMKDEMPRDCWEWNGIQRKLEGQNILLCGSQNINNSGPNLPGRSCANIPLK